MRVVVQKFGGSSVATVDRLKTVARKIVDTRDQGYGVVAVVSAMGDTTDELLSLARQMSDDPPKRELDMLLSVGERISMALLSIAIQDLGGQAISFTGSQCGIVTNHSHANARIIDVRPFRVQDELEAGRIVIVAGYQGTSYRREITTLGRGGSDTTAIALAASLGAEHCDIFSDVDGVYTADPRVVDDARRLDEIGYEEMQELARLGARILNAQAVEFARRNKIAIFARSTFEDGPGTAIRRPDGFPDRELAEIEANGVRGVAGARDALLVRLPAGSEAAIERALDDLQEGAVLSLKADTDGNAEVCLSAENVADPDGLVVQLRELGAEVRLDVGLASAVGTGVGASPAAIRRVLATLRAQDIQQIALHTSGESIRAVVPEAQTDAAVRALHAEFIADA